MIWLESLDGMEFFFPGFNGKFVFLHIERQEFEAGELSHIAKRR